MNTELKPKKILKDLNLRIGAAAGAVGLVFGQLTSETTTYWDLEAFSTAQADYSLEPLS